MRLLLFDRDQRACGWDDPSLPTKTKNGKLLQSTQKEMCTKQLLPRPQNGSNVLSQRENGFSFLWFHFTPLSQREAELRKYQSLISLAEK